MAEFQNTRKKNASLRAGRTGNAPGPLAQDFPWSYEGETGPANWGRYFPESNGRRQSPVNIENAIPSPQLMAIQFFYKSSPLRVVNDGYTIQFDYAPGSSIQVNGKMYELVQFHFHRLGEHTVDGFGYPMEGHLVHVESETQSLAVVAFFLKKGRPHPTLQKVWDIMPSRKGKVTGRWKINARTLLVASGNSTDRYYNYDGSQTTPPCNEGVAWYVLKAPTEISAAQIAHFQKLFKGNPRPVQPLFGRVIREPGSR